MRDMIRYGFILGLICLIAGSLLAGVNFLTKPRIIAQAQEEEESSLREVMPSAIYFDAVKSGRDIVYYKARDKDGKVVGLAFKTSSRGYSSTIETMVAMNEDGTITAIKILNHNETPGLGSRITEPSFTRQFANKNIQDLDRIDSITGATISSKAVIDSVKKKAGEIKELISNDKIQNSK